MERLTKTINGVVVYIGPGNEFDNGLLAAELSNDQIRTVMRRLADYEDTGLEPEVIKDMAENSETRLLTWFENRYGFPAGELMGILEAKQDGRLAVLPCKAGGTVYQIDVERIYEGKITKIIYDTDGIAFDARAIGKTVFLSREEAEAALEGGKKQ